MNEIHIINKQFMLKRNFLENEKKSSIFKSSIKKNISFNDNIL